MSSPYIGEIRIFAGTFAPVGWATCDGQLLAISQNDALYTLIGTTYGGDGQTTFALPDLRGRIPVHQGQGGGLSNYVLGQNGGVESVTLTANTLPIHTHAASAASGVGHISEPGGAVPAAHRDYPVFDSAPGSARAANALTSIGANQPHENMPPFLCINFIISLYGIFPSQN
jgi:microcystin-dependent protein